MAKPASKNKKLAPTNTKNPWLILARITWGIMALVIIIFLVSGIGPYLADWQQGKIGVVLDTNAQGEIMLSPDIGSEAEKAGLVFGDILLSVNQIPLPSNISVDDAAALLRGLAGEPVTLTVRRASGQEKTFTVIRSKQYQETLKAAGLSLVIVANYNFSLDILIALIFTGLSSWVFWRKAPNALNTLIALTLLSMPYSLNLPTFAGYGATALHLDWLYSLVRAAGLLSLALLLFLFPTGTFIPDWGRLVATAVGIWMFPFYAALLDPRLLPSFVVDWAWIIIFIIGIVAQVSRFRNPKITSTEKDTLRKVLIGGIVALAIYVLIWLLYRLLPVSFFSDPTVVWFDMSISLVWGIAAIFFAAQLVPWKNKE